MLMALITKLMSSYLPLLQEAMFEVTSSMTNLPSVVVSAWWCVVVWRTALPPAAVPQAAALRLEPDPLHPHSNAARQPPTSKVT